MTIGLHNFTGYRNIFCALVVYVVTIVAIGDRRYFGEGLQSVDNHTDSNEFNRWGSLQSGHAYANWCITVLNSITKK